MHEVCHMKSACGEMFWPYSYAPEWDLNVLRHRQSAVMHKTMAARPCISNEGEGYDEVSPVTV